MDDLKTISIDLDRDEAIVLFEWLNADAPHTDVSVRAVFDALQSSLERALHEPFAPDYADRVREARARLEASLSDD